MKQLIEKYALVLGKRYTKRQKERFIDELINEIHPFCANIELLKTKKQLSNSTHILVNEPKDKRLIVVASYDTLTKSLLPANYYPFNNSKNKKNAQKEWITTLLLSILAIIVITIIGYFGLIQNKNLLLQIISGLAVLVGGLFCFRLINGTANVVNYNRNSIAVCLLVSLIKEQCSSKVGFVFLDHATDSFKGFKELSTIIGIDKELIYLNCIADGDIVTVAKKATNKAVPIELDLDTKVINKIFNEKEAETKLFALFPNLIEIVSGSRIDNDFAVVNSRNNNDYHINMKRVELIKKALLKRIKE